MLPAKYLSRPSCTQLLKCATTQFPLDKETLKKYSLRFELVVAAFFQNERTCTLKCIYIHTYLDEI